MCNELRICSGNCKILVNGQDDKLFSEIIKAEIYSGISKIKLYRLKHYTYFIFNYLAVEVCVSREK